MRSTVREEEKEKEKGSSSGGKKLLKGIVKGGRKVIAGRSSHSDKSSAVDNASLRDPQSPTTSAPSPNPSATRQPLQETMATPNSYSIQGPTSVVPGDQVAPVQRKIPSNTNAFPNASQLHSRSAQDVQSSSTPRQNIAGMEKHQILPTMGPRNDSHQGTTSSLERFRTNGLDSRPLPGLPYPNMGGQFSSSAESALQGSRQHGREQAGSVGVNGIGETGAALSSPFSGPVDISLRRADTLDNFTPKGTTPSATWPHPPTDYTQAQIQDLQSRLQRAEEDRLRAQEEAESLKTSSLTAVRDARSQTKAAHNQIFAIEESLKKEMLQASSKSADMLSTIQQKEAALAEAERNFEEIQKNMEQVYNDLDKAQDECRQLQEAEKEQLDTITRLNGDFGPHLSNDHFQKLLKDLRTDIQIWAEDFFKGTIEEGRLSPNAFLANVSDDCNEYLRSPIMRPKLVQAYVWSVLNSSVFASNERNNPGLWWAHTRQAQLCGLRALLQPTDLQLRQPCEKDEKEIREYHRWRAMTSRLIESKTAASTIYENVNFELIDKLLHHLKTYKSDAGFQRSKEEYHQRMEDIFYSAIRMDLQMNKQWAYYTIHFPSVHVPDHNGYQTGLPFNGWNMAVDPICGIETCGIVGLVMTPTLFVVGKNNGSGFLDGARVLERSVVMPLGALSKEFEETRRGRNQGDPHQGGKRPNSRSQQGGSQKPRNFLGF